MMFFLLVGCTNGESIESEISNHLDESVTLEKEFKEQQSHITDLEEQEQAIYEEILDLGMDDFDEIKSLSNEALEVIEELRSEERRVGKECRSRWSTNTKKQKK